MNIFQDEQREKNGKKRKWKVDEIIKYIYTI